MFFLSCTWNNLCQENLAICFSFSLFLTVSDPWNSTSGWNGSDPVVYRSFDSPDGLIMMERYQQVNLAFTAGKVLNFWMHLQQFLVLWKRRKISVTYLEIGKLISFSTLMPLNWLICNILCARKRILCLLLSLSGITLAVCFLLHIKLV